MAAVVTNKQAEEFFKGLDQDGNGYLNLKEFRDFLLSQGKFTDDQVTEMFLGMQDDDNQFGDDDRKLTLAEFIDDVCRPSREKGIEEAFNKADKDGSGSLSWDEMEAFLQGTCFDMGVIQKIFDKSGGKMSKDQFKQAMEEN